MTRQRPSNPSDQTPLDPDRRAWLAVGHRRLYFVLNFESGSLSDVLSNPATTAHWDDERKQWWVSRSKQNKDRLLADLRACRAQVIETPYPGMLPPLFFLELESSPHPLENGLCELLRALPRERWRITIKRLSASAHPDGVTGYGSTNAGLLLRICNTLLANPDL